MNIAKPNCCRDSHCSFNWLAAHCFCTEVEMKKNWWASSHH